MKKLKYIDAIRGLAIIGVFIVHVASNKHFPAHVQQLISLGAKGVQLFFIASAFTLFLSMDRRNEREHYHLGNFFIRRFFRIAPMYYLAIFYYYYQNYISGYPGSAGLVISNFLFIHGVSPHWINYLVPGGWSITVEMMFYCIVPFIYDKIHNLNRALSFVTITLCLRFAFLLLMRFVFLPEKNPLNDDFLYYCFPNELPIFGLGIVMFFYIKDGYRLEGLKPMTLILLGAVLVLNCTIRDLIPYHFFISIGFIIFCIYLSKRSPALSVNRFTTFLGKISFSLYLVHFAIHFWILRWFDELNLGAHLPFIPLYLLTVASVFVVSVGVALFFYNMVEVRFQSLGKGLIQKREERYSQSQAA